ncbi:GntR family transcriptional regulator [Aureimonas sp. Leaf454]|uniref:GntR family transcriptional regulator n=1 Tax=Aureimonas sp. Leaf454 TaxID=1736381 RepID=UPI0006F39D74|nr:GntR family transcriptional regulator [Aureimonas sp. Leaf454]KQT46396.1 GntR family transcriptional regulator [Aureimonas sp. Leaf454]
MRSNQAAAIYESLTRAILSGAIAPGAKLSEPAIADEMGVSRAPVREALRRLQERGIVVHVANQGVRVVSPSLDEFLALLDVREALEGMTCRLAAAAMRDGALARLSEIVDAHGRALAADPSGPYRQDEYDTDFHVQIARGCGNPVLADLLCDQFYPRLKLCRAKHQSIKGRGLAAWKEHRRIMEAMLERDAEAAEFLMRRHVRAARAALVEAAGRPPTHSIGPTIGNDGR